MAKALPLECDECGRPILYDDGAFMDSTWAE